MLSLALAALQLGSAAVPPTSPAPQSEEIVVTARRSGMPVWVVTSPRTRIVLVGSIGGVSKDTRWDPAPLTAALVKADRVMFPGSVAVSMSAFAAIGYVPKLIKFATLPKGQSLQGMMPPDQFARLVALKNRGLLKPGFERRHPLFLAFTLRKAAAGKAGFGPDPNDYVRRVVKKNKLKLVPITRVKGKPVANALFATAPRTHVPCLLDAVSLAEAGPGAIKARSDAWAQRRVPAALSSVAERMYHSCWPACTALDDDSALHGTVRRVMTEPQVTVAVVSLSDLARRGGVLDDLVAAGFDVRGPAWK